MNEKKKHVVLGVTGSIAAYKAADIVRRLQDAEFEVSVVMTSEAARFITPLTLTSLSGRPVFENMFEKSPDGEMTHIRLAQDADCLLIAPATANTIAKLAHGLANDLLTCVALATRAPVLIAPGMNDVMYGKPVVQDNIKRLRSFGMGFIDPQKGSLACGRYGYGHLAEAETIVEAVKQAVG